jgi:hypothetical protein
MTARGLRRVGVAVLFVVVAAAAWLLERQPVVAAILLALVAAAAFAVWYLRRGERRVIAAGLRCDLDAIERSAAESAARIIATIALVHHGGFARARTPLCTCGGCENDTMDAELERIARIVRAAYEENGARAYELARELDAEGRDVPRILAEIVTPVRLLTRLVAYAAAVEEDAAGIAMPVAWVELVVKLADVSWPMVRWPIRLAAAREAAARGDLARTKHYLVDLPAWPEGTPLERVRRRLLERSRNEELRA